MSIDKRTVATDALETLGFIIGENEKRDAIHLAVEPIIAAEKLLPGDHIGIKNGKATRDKETKKVGIVDPFIQGTIEEGQRFWLIVYPRQITSLRHVWEHPDFDDISDNINSEMKNNSQNWIKNWAKENEIGYQELMGKALHYINENGDYEWNEGERFDGTYIEEEFWIHFKNVTGISKPSHLYDNFLGCGC